MYRKGLIDILRQRPMGLHELALLLDAKEREVEEDLLHLEKSLRHEPFALHIEPARCRKCGFTFQRDKLHKPSKCPRCHGSWISEPLLSIEER